MMQENTLRQKTVDLFRSHLGEKETNGKCPQWIVDAYNECVAQYAHTVTSALPRTTKMVSSYAWCAATCTAVQYLAGLGKHGVYEMSCTSMISIASKLGIWLEDESKYTADVARIGDLVIYDWQDGSDYSGNNVNSPDHVGMVAEVHDDHMVVIEGNNNNSICERKLSYNGRYIRGFIQIDYASAAAEIKTEEKTTVNASLSTADILESLKNIRTEIDALIEKVSGA